MDIEVPQFVVKSNGQEDRVEIPGGGTLLHAGRPALPSYRFTVELPPGSQVQDVRLLAKSGLTVVDGLNLPPVVISIPGSAERLQPPPQETDDWWPTEDFCWSVDQMPGHKSLLSVRLHPFKYKRQTAESHFYSTWKFALDTTDSPVSINRLATGKGIYSPGEPVEILLYVKNESAQSVDVVVESVVKDPGGDPAGGVPLRTMTAVQGIASFHAEWDSVSAKPGAYVMETVLRRTDGSVLDRGVCAFDIAGPQAQIVGLTITPDAFRRGEDVELSATITNTGQYPLSAILVLQVQNASGSPVAEFRHELTDCPPLASTCVTSLWTQASLAPRDCQVLAYMIYPGGEASETRATDWTTAPLLVDALIYTAAGPQISWPSVSGRTYTVAYSTDLSTMPFKPLAEKLPATPPQNVFIDNVARSCCFYRITEHW